MSGIDELIDEAYNQETVEMQLNHMAGIARGLAKALTAYDAGQIVECPFLALPFAACCMRQLVCRAREVCNG